MSARAVATATEAAAAEAASTMFPRGNAVDAVIAGVFAAAARGPSVLLGPVQILVGGAGFGLRAVDGRTHQPGRGAPRPRGFTPDDTVLPASRVGVPALPAALAAMLASSGTATLAQAMAPAIAAADDDARLAVLKRIAQRGPAALSDARIAPELVNAAGRVAGGLLTAEDLDALRPAIVPAPVHALGPSGRRAALVPWRAPAVLGAEGAATLTARSTHVVAAVDGRGLMAIACYERPEEGLTIPELGLVAPFTAAPVLRGQTRVRPGDPREAAAPIAVVEQAGVIDLAVGLTMAADAERILGDALRAYADDDLVAAALPVREGNLVGVLGTKNGARLLRARTA